MEYVGSLSSKELVLSPPHRTARCSEYHFQMSTALLEIIGDMQILSLGMIASRPHCLQRRRMYKVRFSSCSLSVWGHVDLHCRQIFSRHGFRENRSRSAFRHYL